MTYNKATHAPSVSHLAKDSPTTIGRVKSSKAARAGAQHVTLRSSSSIAGSTVVCRSMVWSVAVISVPLIKFFFFFSSFKILFVFLYQSIDRGFDTVGGYSCRGNSKN